MTLVPAPDPDEQTRPIPGQIDLFTGKEHPPHETEPTSPGRTALAGDPIAFPFPDRARAR